MDLENGNFVKLNDDINYKELYIEYVYNECKNATLELLQWEASNTTEANLIRKNKNIYDLTTTLWIFTVLYFTIHFLFINVRDFKFIEMVVLEGLDLCLLTGIAISAFLLKFDFGWKYISFVGFCTCCTSLVYIKTSI